MDQALDGRVAFVTDGWYGLGASITDSLLSRGAAVAVGYHRDDPELAEFMERHRDEPVSKHQGSLGVAVECRRAVGEVVRQHGRIDILVALLNFKSSGILSTRRSLSRLTDGEWQRAFNVHLSGGFHIAQAALDHMIAAKFGRIIFVLGMAGVGDGQGHHATIRGSLRTLTRELARDVAGSGITVNRVSTGLINDELLAGLPEETLEQAFSRVPVGRLAEPSEVTRVIEFLADPESGYLTGQLISVDGGLTIDVI